MRDGRPTLRELRSVVTPRCNSAVNVFSMSPFGRFDDVLRSVLDVTPDAHVAMTDGLERERAVGALMTRSVHSRLGHYIHSVDGVDAFAARLLEVPLAPKSPVDGPAQ